MMLRIGILVATGPSAGDFPAIASAALSAEARGDEVGIFLMDDGVGYASDARFGELLAAGVEVALCAMDAEARGVDCQAAAGRGITVGSQYDHARLLKNSDRFLSFT